MARMTSALIAALAGFAAHAGEVPFVGCVEHGMADENPAPARFPDPPVLPEPWAKHLALYGSERLAVMAPRGWRCAILSGSNGGFLMVVPPDGEPADWYQANFTGPAIQLSFSDSGTSGRFQVASIFARIFPDQDRFVRSVIAEGIEPAENFPSGPYPDDYVVSKTQALVEYQTPSGAEGLGLRSHLATGGAISGAAMIQSDGLLKLDIRLPDELAALMPIIRDWVEAHYNGR